MSVVTQRPVVKHRWDGQVFHVRIFNSPAEAMSASDGPWADSRAMAKASFEEQRRRVQAAAAPESAAPRTDPAAMKRPELFRFLKARGVKTAFGETNDSLRAKAAQAA